MAAGEITWSTRPLSPSGPELRSDSGEACGSFTPGWAGRFTAACLIDCRWSGVSHVTPTVPMSHTDGASTSPCPGCSPVTHWSEVHEEQQAAADSRSGGHSCHMLKPLQQTAVTKPNGERAALYLSLMISAPCHLAPGQRQESQQFVQNPSGSWSRLKRCE